MPVTIASVLTFVVLLVLQVGGEGHQVPAGPGAHQRNGGTGGALGTLLPLANISQLHEGGPDRHSRTPGVLLTWQKSKHREK